MSTRTPDSLGDRYGAARPRHHRALVVLVAGIAGIALAWLAWVVLVHGRPAAQSQLVSFDASGEHAVAARFTVVRRSTDVEASCLLRARSSDHAIVGELNVEVGADQPESTTLVRRMRTERAATSVEMVGCTADGQSHRR